MPSVTFDDNTAPTVARHVPARLDREKVSDLALAVPQFPSVSAEALQMGNAGVFKPPAANFSLGYPRCYSLLRAREG